MKKKKRKKTMVIILLIIIIVLVVLTPISINKLGRISQVETGNFETFDVICAPGGEYDCKIIGQDSMSVSGNVDGLDVYDKDITWNSKRKLNIFSNPYFKNEKKIAPGSSNAYEFIINNNYNYDLKYEISFQEDNEYNVNMKYSLKRNGKYILGDKNSWESLNNLEKKEYELKKNKSDKFLLEWKWVDAKNDTSIGVLDDAHYGLEINIIANSN